MAVACYDDARCCADGLGAVVLMNEYYKNCCVLARIVEVEPPKDAASAKAWFEELKASGILERRSDK